MRGFSEEERREGDAETLAAGEIGHPAMNGIRPEEEASEIRAEVPPTRTARPKPPRITLETRSAHRG